MYNRQPSLAQQKPHRRILFYVVGATVVLPLLVGGMLIWRHASSDEPSANQQNSPASSVNMQPATDKEKQQSDNAKDDIIKDNKSNQPTPSTTTKTVAPTVTNADFSNGQLEVNAYVSGIIEDGATCTLTASQAGKTVSRQTVSIANVSDTVCPTFVVERSAFPTSGQWQVVVAYSSAKASGNSSLTMVNIQ